jgi:hypothetical protein
MPQPPETVLEAVAEAAEMWGAEWQPGDRGGRLRLPVVHGLRRGIVRGTLRAEPASAGTALFFDIEDASYSVNKSAFAILLLGGIGGLILVLWPLSMSMLQLAPLGAVLALVAWLLVVSRLRNSDTVDFFEQVADLAQDL